MYSILVRKHKGKMPAGRYLCIDGRITDLMKWYEQLLYHSRN
jgi:hypothetical protein